MELYVHDPEVNKTRLISDINPGESNGGAYDMVEMDGLIYFMSITEFDGRQLFVYDPVTAELQRHHY